MSGTSDPRKSARKSGVSPMFWIIGLAAIAAGLVVGWYARDFFAVNACLDAGGSWANPGVCIGAPPRVQ